MTQVSKGDDEEEIKKKEEEEILQMSQSVWQEELEEGDNDEPRPGPSR